MGKYRVLRQVGEGAFGSVFEAVLPGPQGFSKRVALKRLRADLLREEPRLIRSLINEARIGGLLHHPHIVDILGFDEIDGQYYLAMEYVDGPTLQGLLDASRLLGEPLPRYAVVAWATQICRGLAHAHALQGEDGEPLGLVHRDLKPANVILDAAGAAKILDFGIARAASNLGATTTAAGARGTPRYMSPEQTTGRGEITASSDIFSMGAVLYEMAAGRSLFEADSLPAVVHAIVYEEVEERLDEAEAALPGCRPILARALQKDPQERYATAAQMADDLLALGRDHPQEEDLAGVVARLTPVVEETVVGGSAGPPGVPAAAPRPSRMPVVVLGVAVVALAAVLASVLWARGPARHREPAPGSLADAVDSLAGAARIDPSVAASAAPAPDEVVEATPEPTDIAPTAPHQPVAGASEDPGPAEPDPVPPDAPDALEPAAALGPAAGTVSLYSRPWVDIYVDGELIKSDVRLKAHPVGGGRHQIRLVCAREGNREKLYVIDVDGQDLDLGCWDFQAMAPCQG